MKLVERILEIFKPGGPSKPEAVAEVIGYKAGKIAQGSLKNVVVLTAGVVLGAVVLIYSLVKGFQKGFGVKRTD